MAETQNTGLSRLRMILWGLVIIVGVGATLLYFIRPPERPVGLFGGTFTLQSTEGGDFTQDDLRGVPTLIFFGYTFCPEVCPTTLAESTSWRNTLGLTSEDLRLIFVSVDPKRDTIATMQEYLGIFGSPIIGLTGTDVEVEKAKKAFGVFSKISDDDSSTEYLIDHTASLFMLNEDGQFQGTIAFGEATQTAIEKVKRLVEG